MFCFDAAIHEAVMALPPDERRDCEKVNQAAKISKKPQKKPRC